MDNIRNNFRNHKFTLKTTNLNFYANVMRKKFEFLAIKNPCEYENISRITYYTQNYLFSPLIYSITLISQTREWFFFKSERHFYELISFSLILFKSFSI